MKPCKRCRTRPALFMSDLCQDCRDAPLGLPVLQTNTGVEEGPVIAAASAAASPTDAPALSQVFYVVAALQVIGGFILCIQLWPGEAETGYAWKAIAYVSAMTWLAAGLVSGFLFIAIGNGLHYLRDIRDSLRLISHTDQKKTGT